MKINNLQNKPTLFLGLGYELSLILNYLLKDFNPPLSNLSFTRRNKRKALIQEQQYNIKGYTNNLKAIKQQKPEIIFIGVKPQDIPDIIPQLLETKHIWKHLIFISASTPFETITKLFPDKIISNIIPDVHFNSNNPSGFSQYCSTLDTDPIIETLFQPTLASLLKVSPEQMTICTVLLCQATPLIYLGVELFKKQDSIKDLHEYLELFIKGILDLNDSSIPEAKNIHNGYIDALSKISLSKEQSFEILNIVLDSLIEETIRELPKDNNEIDDQIDDWSTEGGYDETGVNAVKEMLVSNMKLSNIPNKIIQAQLSNGVTLEKSINKDIGLSNKLV
jgi:pyrroline-5-carboxylate reductase